MSLIKLEDGIWPLRCFIHQNCCLSHPGIQGKKSLYNLWIVPCLVHGVSELVYFLFFSILLDFAAAIYSLHFCFWLAMD